MAAIGKIREKSTFLVIIVGGAMVAFILSDLFSNKNKAPEEQYVGQVGGKEINMVTYEKRVNEVIESRNTSGQPIDDRMRQNIRDQVWQQMVQENILYKQMQELGMTMSSEEFNDMRFGENVVPSIRNSKMFQDSASGQFNPDLARRYFTFLQNQYPTVAKLQEEGLKDQRMYEKYNDLIKYGMFANNLEGRDQYEKSAERRGFQYAVQKYASVPDSTLAISQSDLESYYNKHKDEDKFQQKASVDLTYVDFSVTPTPGDIQEDKKHLAELIPDFKRATNDSLFILKNSDTKNASPISYIKGQGSAVEDSLVFNASVGDVVGPFEDGQMIDLAKIKSFSQEDQARVRHILLRSKPGVTTAQLKDKADSILRVIKQKHNFDEMVQKFSEDPGSKSRGGVYDWFNRGRMVKEFSDASFKPVGTMSVVTTQYGVHIVEVLGRRQQPTASLLMVQRKIEPSSATFNDIFQKASDLSYNTTDMDAFKKWAKEKGYDVKEAKKTPANSSMLDQIPNSRDVIRWANDPDKSELGKVSKVFDCQTNYIVAIVTKRHEEGTAPLEDVKDIVKQAVAKQKKVEKFKSEMAGSSLEDIAKANKLQVQDAYNISGINMSLPGGPSEPYVAGEAMAMNKGDLSKPLEGNMGVYVIKITTATEPDQKKDDFTAQRDNLDRQFKARVSTINGMVYNALKDQAGVKDERAKYY